MIDNKPMVMRDLTEIIAEVKKIYTEHPVMEDRIEALEQAGYENIEYRYLKGYKVVIPSTNNGLLSTTHLPKKGLYRIQIGYTELKKGYPAAWCVEVSSEGVNYVKELPF